MIWHRGSEHGCEKLAGEAPGRAGHLLRRAGRDDQPAKCILFYRFADIFRLSTMVFTEQTGLEKLYGIVAYCLDVPR